MKPATRRFFHAAACAALCFEVVHTIFPLLMLAWRNIPEFLFFFWMGFCHVIAVLAVVAISYFFLVKREQVNPSTVLIGIPIQWVLFGVQQGLIANLRGLSTEGLGGFQYYGYWWLMPFLIVGISWAVALIHKLIAKREKPANPIN